MVTLKRCFQLTFLSAYLIPAVTAAEVTYPTAMTFDAALSQSVIDAKSSGYQELIVATTGGVFRGEFVQQTNEVLVLKQNTGTTHLKTGKEKIALSYIRIDTIVAVSVHTIE